MMLRPNLFPDERPHLHEGRPFLETVKVKGVPGYKQVNPVKG